MNSERSTVFLTLLLGTLSLILHPYVLTIVVAIIQVWRVVRPIYFLPLYSVSLATFWGSREYGFSTESFLDDAIANFRQFDNIRDGGVIQLFGDFASGASGNELVYGLYVYFVGLFTSEHQVFAFLTYLLIATLVSLAGIAADRRYYMVFIAILFYGLGSFVQLEIYHLWRSAIASLLCLLGVLYFERNRGRGVIILGAAFMVHLIAFIGFASFVMLKLLARFPGRYRALAYLCTVVVATFVLYRYYTVIDVIAGKDLLGVYFSGASELYLFDWFKLIFVCVVFVILHFREFDDRTVFITTMIVFTILVYALLPGTSFSGRFYQFVIVFVNLALFQIVIRIQRKVVITLTLFILFTAKFVVLVNSELTLSAFPYFTNIASGTLFFVFRSLGIV